MAGIHSSTAVQNRQNKEGKGESKEEIRKSVAYLNSSEIQGVKFQLLHILRGTRLGNLFENGMLPFDVYGRVPQQYTYPFTLEEYADLVCDCISWLKKDIVVHRITGDAPRKDLLAPLWSSDKKRVLNTIRHRMKERDLKQGSEEARQG